MRILEVQLPEWQEGGVVSFVVAALLRPPWQDSKWLTLVSEFDDRMFFLHLLQCCMFSSVCTRCKPCPGHFVKISLHVKISSQRIQGLPPATPYILMCWSTPAHLLALEPYKSESPLAPGLPKGLSTSSPWEHFAPVHHWVHHCLPHLFCFAKEAIIHGKPCLSGGSSLLVCMYVCMYVCMCTFVWITLYNKI